MKTTIKGYHNITNTILDYETEGNKPVSTNQYRYKKTNFQLFPNLTKQDFRP